MNKKDIIERGIFDICTVLFFIMLINIMYIIDIHFIIKFLICIIFGYIFGYMSGYQKKQTEALKESLKLAEAVESYYKTTIKQMEDLGKFIIKDDNEIANITNLELGNISFNTNKNQCFKCPEYIIALLNTLDEQLCRVMKNINQTDYDSPFSNTGNKFKNNIFEVEAFNWDDDYNQSYNFKCGDVEISWYKYLGRDTTINNIYQPEYIINMFNTCLQSILDMDAID